MSCQFAVVPFDTFMAERVLHNVKCNPTFMTERVLRNAKCYPTFASDIAHDITQMIKCGACNAKRSERSCKLKCGACDAKCSETSCKPALKQPADARKKTSHNPTIECGVEPAHPGDITPGVNLYDRGGLGWVRIVYVDTRVTNAKARKVIVRPVDKPGGCFLSPLGVAALHRRFPGTKVVESSDKGFSVDVGCNPNGFMHMSGMQHFPMMKTRENNIRSGMTVWVWDRAGAITSLDFTRLYVRGNEVKADYNKHCHCFTCHKYKDTFRAKYCRMGFGRRAMPSTAFTMVTAKKKPEKNEDGTDKQRLDEDERGRESVATAAPEILPPEQREKAAVCLDHMRLSGKAFTRVHELLAEAIAVVFMEKVDLPKNALGFIVEYLAGPKQIYDDCYQTEPNVIFAGLLGCNTNVSALGGLVQSANAMFYLAGYLSKNPIKPCHFVTCMTAARNTANRFGSTAKDAGTSLRNATFLLQNMLNRMNATAEVSDTQASMLLLGEPSWISSHPFWFCFVKSALNYQIRKLSEEMVSGELGDTVQARCSQLSEILDVGTQDLTWSHPSIQGESEDTAKTLGHAHGGGSGGKLYTDQEGVVHALSQHEHYRYRVADWDVTIDGVVPDMRWWFQNARGTNHQGWRTWNRECGLHKFNLLQYASHIEIVKMPKNFDSADRSGQKVNMFRFNKEHPLHLSHVQKLRSRDCVVCVSGKSPTPPTGKCPEGNPRARRRWIQQADAWAFFMGTLLCPWNRDGLCECTTYEEVIAMLERWREHNLSESCRTWSAYINRDRAECEDHETPEVSFPDPTGNYFLDFYENLSSNLRSPQLEKKLVNDWRYEKSDSFTKVEQAKAILHSGTVRSKEQSEANALAIARLIDINRKKLASGIRDDTQNHLDRLQQQLRSLDVDDGVTCRDDAVQPAGLPTWDTESASLDAKWANERIEQLKGQETADDARVHDGGSDSSPLDDNGQAVFDDLWLGDSNHKEEKRRYPLSPDQRQALDYAIDKLTKGEQLLLFVHGPPGTGKTLLAGRIMEAARRVGISSRFTALSGAAASLHGGCTMHYLTSMGIALPKHHHQVGSIP